MPKPRLRLHPAHCSIERRVTRASWLALTLCGLVACSTTSTAMSPASTDTVAASTGEESDAQADIASAVPDTDIFVFRIDPSQSSIVTGFQANVTRRAGYDNQPKYVPNSNNFLFSSILDGRQSDVYEYDDAKGALIRRTSTDLSEYSPTPRPGGGFSAVVVEEDGTQRLWHYASSTTGTSAQTAYFEAKEAIRGDVTGVGYHAWLDDQLGVFIVDEPLMHLDVIGIDTSSRYTLAVNPGRSLHARPGSGQLSFVQHRENETSRLTTWDGEKVVALVDMPEGVEDMTWLSDGRALTIAKGKLLVWSPGAARWSVATDLSGTLPGEVTRLAVNDRGTRLAVVSSMEKGE